MITHILVGALDLTQSKVFYDATLGLIGYGPSWELRPGMLFYSHGGFAFGICLPNDGRAANVGNGGTIGFSATGTDQVNRFHATGLAYGGRCEGPPGPRPGAPGNTYAAYLRDPSGNKICVSCQNPMSEEVHGTMLGVQL